MSKLHFDALEACLQALEQGEMMDAALARFPALADDLRPMLQVSLRARTLAGPPPSDALQRRGRARLLQRAAEMREAKAAPRRAWLFHLRPLAAAFMLVVFFLSGTGLVRASSSSLPGDNLYPVKRAWEGARILFAFSEMKREGLEMEYENERLEETRELLARGRIERVSFSGYVTSQTDGLWEISDIPVLIGAQTVLPPQPIRVGMAVTVYGMTVLNGNVEAYRVDVLPLGVPLPVSDPEEDGEDDNETVTVPTLAPTPTARWTPIVLPTPTAIPSQLPPANINDNDNGDDSDNDGDNANGGNNGGNGNSNGNDNDNDNDNANGSNNGGNGNDDDNDDNEDDGD